MENETKILGNEDNNTNAKEENNIDNNNDYTNNALENTNSSNKEDNTINNSFEETNANELLEIERETGESAPKTNKYSVTNEKRMELFVKTQLFVLRILFEMISISNYYTVFYWDDFVIPDYDLFKLMGTSIGQNNLAALVVDNKNSNEPQQIAISPKEIKKYAFENMVNSEEFVRNVAFVAAKLIYQRKIEELMLLPKIVDICFWMAEFYSRPKQKDERSVLQAIEALQNNQFTIVFDSANDQSSSNLKEDTKYTPKNAKVKNFDPILKAGEGNIISEDDDELSSFSTEEDDEEEADETPNEEEAVSENTSKNNTPTSENLILNQNQSSLSSTNERLKKKKKRNPIFLGFVKKVSNKELLGLFDIISNFTANSTYFIQFHDSTFTSFSKNIEKNPQKMSILESLVGNVEKWFGFQKLLGSLFLQFFSRPDPKTDDNFILTTKKRLQKEGDFQLFFYDCLLIFVTGQFQQPAFMKVIQNKQKKWDAIQTKQRQGLQKQQEKKDLQGTKE